MSWLLDHWWFILGAWVLLSFVAAPLIGYWMRSGDV